MLNLRPLSLRLEWAIWSHFPPQKFIIAQIDVKAAFVSFMDAEL